MSPWGLGSAPGEGGESELRVRVRGGLCRAEEAEPSPPAQAQLCAWPWEEAPRCGLCTGRLARCPPPSSAPCWCSQIDQMFVAFPPDVTGNLDYKNLVHIITHGEEKD